MQKQIAKIHDNSGSSYTYGPIFAIFSKGETVEIIGEMGNNFVVRKLDNTTPTNAQEQLGLTEFSLNRNRFTIIQ